jgi:sugar phosphate isomerase/epimerase
LNISVQLGEAVLGVPRQHGNVGLLVARHRVEVAELELRHPAAAFLVDDDVRDLVVFEQLDQVVADAGLVVVDVAGGIDRHPARRALTVVDHGGLALLGRAPAEAARGQLGHPGVRVNAQMRVHLAPRELRAVDGVDRLHHHRDAGEAAVHVGGSQEFLARLDLALAELDRLGAQHQVREVQVPLVRRHVGALGHVAQVAQVALVDHAPVGLLLDAVHLAILGGVHQVEEVGEALAQADAAAAAVADVEDALHLLQGRGLVVELGVLPVDGVAGGGFEVAFAHVGVRCPSRGRPGFRRLSEGKQGARSPLSGEESPAQSTRASSAFW